MKILQIGTNDYIGGAAVISYSIKNELERRGHITSMFVSSKTSNDVNIFTMPQKIHRYFQMLLSNDIDLSATDWIINTKEFKETDVVHIHNLHGWYFNLKTLEKISKLKPVVWTLHDMWSITPHCAHSYECELKDGFYQCPSLDSYPRITWHNEKYLTRKKREIYNNSKLNIVVPSVWLKNKVEQSVLKDKEIDLIYNGINENIFMKYDQVESRKKLNLLLDKKIILFMSDGGKNNEFKGWDFVIKIIEKYKDNNDILFVCLGGKENGYDSVNKNLLFIPKITNKEVLSRYFSASDVLLYPSLADNCPLVILEAMACGLPIVTFKVGGISELVEHLKNGYVANYKNNDDLIKGVQFVLNLTNIEIEIIREESRLKIINNFTTSKMVDQYERLYQDVISNFNKTKI